MRILVTGSSGFVGINLIQYLRNYTDYELFIPDRKKLDLLNPPKIPCGCSDGTTIEIIISYLLTNKIDTIIHLGGNVGGIGYNKDNQGKLGYENLIMGLNILEAARIADIKKLIMIGTTCSYPCVPNTIPFIEDELFDGMPELTNSGYGIAKRTLVKLGIEYALQYKMDIVNLIPTNMFGPHDHFEEEKSHVIPALIKKFENHKRLGLFGYSIDGVECFKGRKEIPVILWGDGSASRDFLYVEDFARAIVLALNKNVGPNPINIGSGIEISIKTLAELIKTVGHYDDANIVWDASKPNGQPVRCLSINRAKELLGWEPKISFVEGLSKTIEWYRNEQNRIN